MSMLRWDRVPSLRGTLHPAQSEAPLLPPRPPQGQPGLEGEPYEAEDFVCDYHLEMLSLSQDQQNPPCIQFDDSNWQLHLTSLKPLGLNVLLNLCNAGVTERLCRFSDHLRNIALQESHSAVLPIHVPWGLCELARLIGTWPLAGLVAGRVGEAGPPTPHGSVPGTALMEITANPFGFWASPPAGRCCATVLPNLGSRWG